MEETELPEIDQIVYLEKSESNAAVDEFAEPFAGYLSHLTKPSARKFAKSLEKRFVGVEDAGSRKVEIDEITGYNAFDVVAPPYNKDSLAKLYEKSAPHASAIDAKVSNIVGLGFDLVESEMTKLRFAELDKEKVKRLRKKLQREKIALLERMDDMNKEDNFLETLIKVYTDYEATGEGYIEIGRTSTGDIGYIGHIPSKSMRVRRERDGFVQILSNKAVFFRNFGEDTPDPFGSDASPNEVIHLKNYSPSSTYYGVPDIVSAQEALAGNKFAADFNLDYFENKAVPRHVITLKGATLKPALTKTLLEFFETGLKGKNHRSIFVPLPADVDGKKVEFKIEPVEAGVQDASFNNYRKSNISEILMAHRVPVSKISMAEGVSLAAARDADKNFKEQVCQPAQKILEKKLNRIVKEFTDLLVIKLNEMTLTDENTQSQIDERRIKTGTETRNEQRARRGLPGVPGGDSIYKMEDKATGNTPNAENRAAGNRERDAQRSAAATDSVGNGRATQGEGRTNGRQ